MKDGARKRKCPVCQRNCKYMAGGRIKKHVVGGTNVGLCPASHLLWEVAYAVKKVGDRLTR